MDPATLTGLAIGACIFKFGTAALGIATIGLFFRELFRASEDVPAFVPAREETSRGDGHVARATAIPSLQWDGI